MANKELTLLDLSSTHDGWHFRWQYSGVTLRIDRSSGALEYQNKDRQILSIRNPRAWNLRVEDAPQNDQSIEGQGRLLVLQCTTPEGPLYRETIGYWSLQYAKDPGREDPKSSDRVDDLTWMVRRIDSELQYARQKAPDLAPR